MTFSDHNQYNFETLEDTDLLLISPYPTPPAAPLAALGYLASIAKSKNVSVQLLDLGLDAKRWFLDPKKMKSYLEKFQRSLIQLKLRSGSRLKDIPTHDILLKIDDSIRSLRSPFVDQKKHEQACNIFYGAFALYDSLENGRISPPGTYFAPWKGADIREVQNALLGTNDLHADLAHSAASAILKHRYKVVGFSITHGDQWFTALGLAKALRLQEYEGLIIFGGTQVSLLHHQLIEMPDFYLYVDAFSPKRGDCTIGDICDHINSNIPFKNIRNISYRAKDGKIVYTGQYYETPFSKALVPDYSGLHLKDYLAPDLILPIAASSKCYWGKCRFCMVGRHFLADRSEHLSGREIFNHMEILYDKFKCRNFFITDDSAVPKTLSEMSKLVIQKKLPFRWQVQGLIPEKSIDESTLALWAEGGCKSLSVGFESGSERILKLLGKKHNLQDIENFLVLCQKYRIMSYCYGFFGHPFETKDDIASSLEFKKRYENIATYFLGYIWRLNPCSIDFEMQHELNIKVVEDDINKTFGKPFANIRWTSETKDEMKRFLDANLSENGAVQKKEYLSDWMQWGHAMLIPYEWTIN